MPLETVTEIKVKPEDIDELGHVNNKVYVAYLEKAREHWYSEAGLPFAVMKKRNLGTVVLKLDVFFKKEARLGDILKVKTRPIRLGTKSFVLEQIIFNEANEAITEATITNVMFDTTVRKSTTVADEIARHFPK
ncbi:acyl-CoA thioesterase [Bacillus alveayuensis]|jgi:YbgC/YbaW family acyl-CoA thioester hydrolase|uniref:acyl-CoA thioesterase n=1 Tax=Aeribacillus alveayuensis TaxID=279215 RepID=UPI0005D10799|nr:acyl-CoA thioesterase [Bacillus alveayuensis]